MYRWLLLWALCHPVKAARYLLELRMITRQEAASLTSPPDRWNKRVASLRQHYGIPL